MNTVNRIFELMEINHLNAKEFAKKVGVSQGNVTDWKTGRAKPSVNSLQKIADAFNISIDYLIGNINNPSCIDTITRYLKPLKLTENQFNLLKKISIPYLQKDPHEEIVHILSGNSKKDIDAVLDAFEIIADLAQNFEQSTKLNQINYWTQHINSLEKNRIFSKKNDYDVLFENTEITDVVKNNLIEALNKLDKSQIVDDFTGNYYNCPVYGQISAGQPNWAEECLEGYLPIDPNLMNIVDPEECFFLRVNGESMNKLIRNGAYALIRKQEVVENGEIAVVLVNGYDATLKKFTRQNDLIILEPMSTDPNFTTQVYAKDTEIKILGKYIGKFEMNS